MKKKCKTVLTLVLAAALCFTSVCPALAAEEAGEAASKEVIAEEAAAEEDENIESYDAERPAGDSVIKGDEDIVKEEVTVPEVAEVIENPTVSEHGEEAAAAAQGSASGSSTITWTQNSMPATIDITSLSLRKRAYLAAVKDGYMRVLYDGKNIVIEYFDQDFHMTRQGYLPMELELWGGFYQGQNAYYIVEGGLNTDCIDGTEVVRIIKYDTNWKRLGAGKILAKNGWEYEIRYPFDYGCVNMDEVNGKLYVVTGREGYVDESVGMGHQGMMLIRMDEKSFATEIVYGDFYHSFAQYMCHSGENLYLGELSEGGRCTSLSRFETSKTGTDYFDAFSDRFSVLDYGGTRDSAWAIPCYASVDDMAISSGNVLCLGTSIDQTKYDSVTSDTAHNIYLTVTSKSNLDKNHTTVKWLTNYSGGGKSFIGVNITKVNDDRFLVSWEELPADDSSLKLADPRDTLSSGLLHYVFVDGSGNKIGKVFTAPAMISDCHPILRNGTIIYYASNDNCLDFYTINAQSGAFKKTVTRVAGKNVTWNFKDGVLSFSGKGDIAVPIDLEGSYRSAVSSASGGYSYSSSDNCWKYLRDQVTGVSIGKGVTSVPEKAFAWFPKLKNVTLPNGLKSIGKEAFFSCESLQELTIPSSVVKIGDDILWTGSYWISDESHVTYATIKGDCNSYAVKYAKKNNISYEAKHSFKKAVTKATTKKNGKSYTKCSLCGQTKSEKVIYYPKTIKLSSKTLTYTGKVRKPTVKVVGSNGKTIAADHYTVTYAKGRKTPGKYSVKIRFKGNYEGSITRYFKILPKPTKLKKLTPESKKILVKWNKQSVQTTGYQIQCATDKKFKKNKKTVKMKGAKKTGKTISGLKGGQKYYVRIRTYKTVKGKNYYSKWSKLKATTVKE